MKRTQPLRLDAIIQQMIDATGLRAQLNRRAVESFWPDVVGANIASYTGRVFVRDTTLHVQIVSAPLKEELSYMKELLVRQLNEAAGQTVIKDIKFI